MFEFCDIKLDMLEPGRGYVEGKRDCWVHRKTTPYIIFAQAFKGHYELEADGQNLILREGEAFFTPPDLPLVITHRINPKSGEMKMRWLHFNVSLLGGIPIERMFDFPLKVEKDICEKMAEPIDELYRLRDSCSIASAIRKNLLGYQCLELLFPLLKPHYDTVAFSRYSARIVQIIEYIRGHKGRTIHIGALAAHCGISRAGLYKLFSATLNTTPQRYINRMRLEQVAEMLRSTDKTIGEIAAELNFPDQFVLCRQFKTQYGMPPNEYRKNKSWQYNGLGVK